MKPQWQKLASLVQKICTLWFQFFSAVFASKGYPFKNIFVMFTDKLSEYLTHTQGYSWISNVKISTSLENVEHQKRNY